MTVDTDSEFLELELETTHYVDTHSGEPYRFYIFFGSDEVENMDTKVSEFMIGRIVWDVERELNSGLYIHKKYYKSEDKDEKNLN